MLGNGYIYTLNILYGIQNRFMAWLRIGILCISKAVNVGKGKHIFSKLASVPKTCMNPMNSKETGLY